MTLIVIDCRLCGETHLADQECSPVEMELSYLAYATEEGMDNA